MMKYNVEFLGGPKDGDTEPGTGYPLPRLLCRVGFPSGGQAWIDGALLDDSRADPGTVILDRYIRVRKKPTGHPLTVYYRHHGPA
jgi:hypothetical protein